LNGEIVRDLRFLDDDDRMKTTISLMEFTLKVTTLDARPTKRQTSRDEELKEASSHENRFPKTLFTLCRCRIAEDDDSGDLLSRSLMHVDEQDEVALAA
jgi:hypothetical protein